MRMVKHGRVGHFKVSGVAHRAGSGHLKEGLGVVNRYCQLDWIENQLGNKNLWVCLHGFLERFN